MMEVVFTINRDDISDERLKEYADVLNEMLGIDGAWEIVRRSDREGVMTTECTRCDGTGKMQTELRGFEQCMSCDGTGHSEAIGNRRA